MKKAILLLTLLLAGVRVAAQTNIDCSAPPNAPFTAEEVTIPAKGYTLAGTLLMGEDSKGEAGLIEFAVPLFSAVRPVTVAIVSK